MNSLIIDKFNKKNKNPQSHFFAIEDSIYKVSKT